MPLFWFRTLSLFTGFPVWLDEFPDWPDEPPLQPASAITSMTMKSQRRPWADEKNFGLFIC